MGPSKLVPRWPGVYFYMVYRENDNGRWLVKVTCSQERAETALKRLGATEIEQVRVF